MAIKFDYPPLLAPGRHLFDLRRLHATCVEAFDNDPGRSSLFYSFECLLQELLVANIPCEIWVDGSFLTQKPHPDDVDVLVWLEQDVADTLDDDQRILVDDIGLPGHIAGVDSFVDVSFPRGHELFDPSEGGFTWAEHFGAETSKRWLKGFAVFRLRETNVGLRIRS